MMPELRPLAPADLDLMVARDAQSFASPPGSARDWFARFPAGGLLGWYDGDTLLAQCTVDRVPISTGHGDAPAALIGSVVSPPEYRRRGYVGGLLGALHRQLRAEGRPFALLHAFKSSFYGRYGYANAFERRTYTGDATLLAPFRTARSGRFVPAGFEDIAQFDQLYQGALRGRFGLVMRDAAHWQRAVLTGHRGAAYSYLWRDDADTARAYLVYQIRYEGQDQYLSVREIVALDPQARAQLFSFLADQDARVRKLSFSSPADAPVNLLLPDPLHCEVETGPMLRVIDVAQAIAVYSFPYGAAGTLTLAVDDATLPENSGCYALSIAGGAGAAERTSAASQLACDVGVLAQLLSRTLKVRTAAAFGMLIVHDKSALALLDALLTGLPGFCGDFF